VGGGIIEIKKESGIAMRRIVVFGLLLCFLSACGSFVQLGEGVLEARHEAATLAQDVPRVEDRTVQEITLPVQSSPAAMSSAAVPAVGSVMREDRWEVVEGSRFETKFDAGLANRTTNLRVASGVVDGAVVAPREIFSFNELVGLATEEKGYKPAKIFLKGEEIEGLGGGICQLSSALFNSADYGGMEIVERHEHSMDVGYVPEGRDAATAYGGVDFKFRNVLSADVRIKAEMGDGVLVVWLEKKM